MPIRRRADAFGEVNVSGLRIGYTRAGDGPAAIMSEFHPAGVRALAHAFGRSDLRDVLPRVTVPTLLLWGEDDRRSPLPVAEAFRASVPGAELVVIPGAGHELALEAPTAVTAEVRRFLLALER